jgi:DnaJ-class molecular chaperone
MNHYEILGVDRQASADDIKRAYRKLASQHHPDKGGDKNRFQEIQVAYDTLSDPPRRQQYDMELQGFGNPGGVRFQWHGHPGNVDEIFAQFGFGDMFGGMRQQRRNKDLKITIPVPLVATLETQTKTIAVSNTKGNQTTVEVTVPRGVTSGTTVKYAGLGDDLFNTIPRGDLYVQFNVHPAENFLINGIDLYTPVSVNCFLAIIGGTVRVNGLDGREFELAIPAGTQPGTRFRIPNQGLYQLNSDVRGNLYVEVQVNIPKNLPEPQLELLRNLINPQ